MKFRTFARIVAKSMTKGGIGVFAPTAITTTNFVSYSNLCCKLIYD